MYPYNIGNEATCRCAAQGIPTTGATTGNINLIHSTSAFCQVGLACSLPIFLSSVGRVTTDEQGSSQPVSVSLKSRYYSCEEYQITRDRECRPAALIYSAYIISNGTKFSAYSDQRYTYMYPAVASTSVQCTGLLSFLFPRSYKPGKKISIWPSEHKQPCL